MLVKAAIGNSNTNPSLFGRGHGMHRPIIIVAGKQNKQYSTHPHDNFAMSGRISSVRHLALAFQLQPKDRYPAASTQDEILKPLPV